MLMLLALTGSICNAAASSAAAAVGPAQASAFAAAAAQSQVQASSAALQGCALLDIFSCFMDQKSRS